MKYSVITYVMGDYEILKEINFDPFQETPEVEYICVTDNPNIKSNTWKIFYDKDLDKEELTPFDRVMLVRYNLFKYCKNDICLRLDASMQLNKPLDVLIKKFIDGNYFGCLLLHPDRCYIIPEYTSWVLFREFNPIEAMISMMNIQRTFNYDFRKKSLIQQGISINRKLNITEDINKKMLFYCKNNDGHFTRLDQTIFTALINTEYNNLNWLFIDNSIFTEDGGGYLTMFTHGGNEKINFKPENFIIPFFNDKEVEVFKLP